jgi:hypothetical protein
MLFRLKHYGLFGTNVLLRGSQVLGVRSQFTCFAGGHRTGGDEHLSRVGRQTDAYVVRSDDYV